MKLAQKPIKTQLSLLIAGLISSTIMHAGSFSLYTESSAVTVGNYAAGVAAEVADASTGWYNPAGLALIRSPQMVTSGNGVFPSSKITGTSTFSTIGLTDYVQSFNNLNGAKDALVPAFHYAQPLGNNFTAGLSIVSPFGLSTEWDRQGPVRYAATFSELLTMNVSPEIGGRLNENFAIGAGIDFQYSRVKFNTVLGAPAYLAELQAAGFPISPTALDSLSYNKGDSFGVGFHAGALLMLNDNHTRVGVNYQSKMHHKYHGYSRLTGGLATPDLDILDLGSLATIDGSSVFRSDGLTSNNIDFPNIVTLSGYQDVNERLALLASVVYTGWDCFKSIELNRVAAYSPGLEQVLVNSISEQNYRNVWRVALGANYRVNDKLLVRMGGGYDETPTVDAFRDIRIADSDRWALSIGAHYQARPNIGLDFGYTHLFSTSRVPVDKTIFAGSGSTYNVNASAAGSADIVGAQITWLMDGGVVSNMKA